MRTGEPALVVYADRLADPGNLGTLVRAAAAFAAAALVASPGSVDLFSPKVVRAGMGAAFALPLYQDVPLAQVAGASSARVPSTVSWPTAACRSTAVPSVAPALLVVGAERAGLSDEALACVTEPRHDPAGRERPAGGRVLERRRGRRHRAVRAFAPSRRAGAHEGAAAPPRRPPPQKE